MIDAEALQARIEQHEIAVRILLSVLQLTLDNSSAMDHATVASVLFKTAEDCERQGDYVAATLLDARGAHAEEAMNAK